MVYGNFIGRDKYETTGTLDGGHFSGVPWVSALMNGRGRYKDSFTGKLMSFSTLIHNQYIHLWFYWVLDKKMFSSIRNIPGAIIREARVSM